MERKDEQEGKLITRTRTACTRKERERTKVERNISYDSKDNLSEDRLEAALRGRKLRSRKEK